MKPQIASCVYLNKDIESAAGLTRRYRWCGGARSRARNRNYETSVKMGLGKGCERQGPQGVGWLLEEGESAKQANSAPSKNPDDRMGEGERVSPSPAPAKPTSRRSAIPIRSPAVASRPPCCCSVSRPRRQRANNALMTHLCSTVPSVCAAAHVARCSPAVVPR